MYDVSAIAIATGRLAINFILRFSSLKIKGKIYIKNCENKNFFQKKIGIGRLSRRQNVYKLFFFIFEDFLN